MRRKGLSEHAVQVVEGEGIRDHLLAADGYLLFPYEKRLTTVLEVLPLRLANHFWPHRRLLQDRKDFGNYIEDRGLRWYEHSMFFPDRYRTLMSIAFPFVATHNHFVFDRGGKVYNRTAPAIKLKPGTDDQNHVELAGVLNSSVACFWLKQILLSNMKLQNRL